MRESVCVCVCVCACVSAGWCDCAQTHAYCRVPFKVKIGVRYLNECVVHFTHQVSGVL